MNNAEAKLKQNMPLLVILTIAGAIVYALPYLRLYYYEAFIETFGMTNGEAGLCGTLFGTFAAIAYLIGGIIADKFSIKKLLSISLLVTGLIGYYLLTIPSPLMVAIVHGIWGITTIMTFWPALMKTLKSLGSKNEQSKVFGFFEGGRGVVNAIYMAAAVAVFGFFTLKGGSLLGIKVLIGAYSTIAVVLGILLMFLLRGIEETGDRSNDVNLKDIGKVMKYPATWLMILIVFCTYFMNMSFYYVGPYVTEAFGASAVFAVILSTASQYIRPFTAIGAGILGDRINSSKVVFLAQVFSLASIALLLLVPGNAKLIPLIVLSVILMYIAMYASQSMHFALMEETDFPQETIGTVIGMICCIGYLPESVCPYLAGKLLDAFPGTTGYKYYFLMMGIVTVIGLFVILCWMSKTKEKRKQLTLGKKAQKAA